MLVLDLLILERVRRLTSAATWFSILFATIMIEALAAVAFARNHFDFFRLAAYIVFLHGFVLSMGSAMALWRARKDLAICSGVSSVILALLTYYVFLIEPYWLETSYWQIASPKIDRPFRIVVVADLQTDRFSDYERGVLRRAMEEKPDLILLAGDYIQAHRQQYRAMCGEINAYLREIHFGAPQGVFAVRGNVDPPIYWHEIFAGLDITNVDVHRSFDLGTLRLTCLGLDESYYPAAKVINPQPGKFHLVLGHVPNFALGRIEGDLLVAGHTHGGQVRIPLIGPIITHSRVPNSWAAGLTILSNGAKLLVSRGIGMERGHAPRLRFLCRPELMVIDLIPEKSK